MPKSSRDGYVSGHGLRRYVYWIVVNNSKRSNRAGVANRAGAWQPNLIKDFKYGLGLAHIPTSRHGT